MKKYLLLLLLFTFPLSAVEPEPELSPWFRNLFEIEPKISATYQYFRSVQTPRGTFRDPSHNLFLDMSLATSPWPDVDVEAEFLLGRTSDISFRFEAFRFTGRYLWANDLWGDPFSISTGITFAFPTSPFLTTLSVPYHGEMNATLHAAIGKEFRGRCSDFWVFHIYGAGGVGFANRGCPWAFGKFFLAWNTPSEFSWGLFLDALAGMGNSSIDPFLPFPGYRNIAYRSVDLSAFYEAPLSYCGNFRISYAYRLYAHNFPQHASTLTFSFLFPFGF